MINSKHLQTIEDFENLKKGDYVACEFFRDCHDYPKQYRFKVFQVVEVKPDDKEVIWQTKNNIYSNYKMFVNGEGNLKSAVLIHI